MIKLTPAREEELREWAYKCWSLSWRELAPVSNSRAQFFKYVKQANFDDETLQRIQLAIQAQARYWRQKAKVEKLIGVPCLSAWFKQERYDDEFIEESATDMKGRINLNECAAPNCSKEVHGPMFKFCSFHIPSAHQDIVKDAYNATGIDYTSPTFVDDCRAICRKKLNIMVDKMKDFK